MTNKIHTHLSGSQNWPKEEGFGHVEVKGRGKHDESAAMNNEF